MREGYQTAQAKGMPILPTIRPWVNEDFLTASNGLEEEYINVNMDYYKDFYDTVFTIRKGEEPYYCQEMYSLLDNAIQEVLSKPFTANATSLLTTANNQFQSNYMSKA